jgi:hypothetical protein
LSSIGHVLSLAPDRGLLIRFVELDASTPGKNPEFLEWFRAASTRQRVVTRHE